MFERNYSKNGGTEEATDNALSTNARVKLRPSPLIYPQEAQYGTFANLPKSKQLAITDGHIENNYVQNNGNREKVEDQHTRMSLWEYVTSPQSPLVQIRDHCHQQWVAVVVTIFLLIWCVYFVFVLPSRSASLGGGANNKCTTPFGTWLGSNNGVAAYSNCNRNYVASGHPSHSVLVGFKEVYTGWEWVSVEYARRYWVMRKLLTFANVQTPSEVFNLTTATGVGMNGKKAKVNLEHYYNHYSKIITESVSNVIEDDNISVYTALSESNKLISSQNKRTNQRVKGTRKKQNTLKDGKFVVGTNPMLREGDLIVYSNHEKSLPGGHVSVVVSVNGPLYNYSRLENSASGNSNVYNNKDAITARKGDNKVRDLVDDSTEVADQSANSLVDAVVPSVVFYTIEVAEQNWDNEKWEDKIDQSTVSQTTTTTTTTTQVPLRTDTSNFETSNDNNNQKESTKNHHISNKKEKYKHNNKQKKNKQSTSDENPTDNNIESSAAPTVWNHEIDGEVNVRRTYARTLLLQISTTADNAKMENNLQVSNSESTNDGIVTREVYSLYDDKAHDIIGWLRPVIK